MTQLQCRKNYYDNASASGMQLGVRQMILQGDGSYKITFPYPFQILGTVQAAGMPSDGTGYPLSQMIIQTAGIQETYTQAWQAMFIAFMYANRDYGNYTTLPAPGTTYEGPYRQYFNNYLNSELIPTNYETFVMPPSEIVRLWVDEVAIADPDTLWSRLRKLSGELFVQSDRAMWGAPGTYTILPPGSPAALKNVRLEIPNGFQPNRTLFGSRKVADWQAWQNLNNPNPNSPSNMPEPIINGENVYVWLYRWNNATGEEEVVYGSKTVPYVPVSAVFSGVNDGEDLKNVIGGFFTDSGDPNLTMTQILMNVPGYTIDNPTDPGDPSYDYGFNNNWDGGAFALPPLTPGNWYGFGMSVDFQTSETPVYWPSLEEYIGTYGAPRLLVNEYKPVE